ncbi:MAG: hypothetical protein C0594_00795 [Marinilabiliales bacterium]|nr:MAG: hypothetical protein C0594_00795 [Marinilabiliales bacterium]
MSKQTIIDAEARKTALELLSNNPSVHISHYKKLLDSLSSLFIIRRKKQLNDFPNERLYYINLITQKFLLHGSSIKKLLSGITIESKSNNLAVPITDPFSIYVLTRAMIEAYLLQNYLSNIKIDKDTLDGRFDIWMRYGLTKRGTEYNSDEAKIVMQSDQETIKQLDCNIKKRDFYNKLPEDKKATFFKTINKEWKIIFNETTFHPVSWKRLLEESGLKSQLTDKIYNFLSWHAHTQSISILQLRNMWGSNFDVTSILTSIKELSIFISFIISDLVLSDKDFRTSYNELNKEMKTLIYLNCIGFRDEAYLIEKIAI